jgi:hypothetical protein
MDFVHVLSSKQRELHMRDLVVAVSTAAKVI